MADAHTAGELLRGARAEAPAQVRKAATFFARLAAVRAGAADADTALGAMHDAIERYHEGGTALNRGAFLAHYAQACGWAGQVTRGLAAVDRSLVEAERTGELWFQAEAWRIKGELLSLWAAAGEHPERNVRAARACLRTAYRSAERQGASAFQRRAAESLSALVDVRA